MFRIFILLTLLYTSVFAANDENKSFVEKAVYTLIGPTLPADETNHSFFDTKESEEMEYVALKAQLEELAQKETKESAWSTSYSTYNTYEDLKSKQKKLSLEIKKLSLKKNKTKAQNEKLKAKKQELKTIQRKLDSLKELESDPFAVIVEPPTISSVPKVGNPVGILEGLSYEKKLTQQQSEYAARYDELLNEADRLESEKTILKRMLVLQPDSDTTQQELDAVQKELDSLKPTLEIFDTTKEVYDKKTEEAKLKVNEEIRQEYDKMIQIGGIILVFLLFYLLIKYLMRKYMSHNESYYTINKVTNFLFLTVLLLVLLFAYIENVSYMVTVIGFASAGIAIAMKDWFMSLMGWWVIVIGGSVHVGDRVKFVRDGVEYVGDIIDISPLRMTMQEDVTLTAVMKNRRAGRVVFIPNNYIFTDMIANYSHAGLKTVWDGIDFIITYDSNIDRAMSIARDITKKYAKGYTDITRNRLNKLRTRYHIKNTNVEPRILSFIEPNGVLISSWYLTNSYATLSLRSKISAEIIKAIQLCEDVEIAYPTQSLYIGNEIPRPQMINQEPSLFDVE